jgi:hypothetical protein
MPAAMAITMPPDDGRGIDVIVWPRYLKRSGSRQMGL